MIQNMVVGFAFDEDRKTVVLIRKQRPQWMAGKLNGVGGKVEPGESMLDAMIREFWEEAGVSTVTSDWDHFMTMDGRGWRIHYFRMFNNKKVAAAETLTDEQVVIVSATCFDRLNRDGISNLVWIVGLALDKDGSRVKTHVSYDGVTHPVLSCYEIVDEGRSYHPC